MATHLSYRYANLGHVTVAEVVKHWRPVLVVVIKRTTGSVIMIIVKQKNKTYTY